MANRDGLPYMNLSHKEFQCIMIRKSSIDSLPAELQSELRQRIIDFGFTGYHEHEAWLAERGYTIGKSSIHRFGQTISADNVSDLRLRCLEIAAHYSNSDTIIENASALMKWVRKPGS